MKVRDIIVLLQSLDPDAEGVVANGKDLTTSQYVYELFNTEHLRVLRLKCDVGPGRYTEARPAEAALKTGVLIG